MKPLSWMRRTAIALTLLAAILPPAARAIAGPRGATVHIRWQLSVTESERQNAEVRFRLADGERVDQYTWRYDLIDPSRENIRALVLAPAVADTNDIDRPNSAIDPAATRTSRRQRFPAQGDHVVAIADGLAITLAAVAALLTLVGVIRQIPAARVLWRRGRAGNQLPAGRAQVRSEENRSDDRPRLWTTAVLLASAPMAIALCLTLWRTPVPIGEAIALFEDAEEQPITRFLTPQQAYYRPIFHLALSALWHSGQSLEATLVWIKLLTIGPVLLLVVLFIWHLRPRTMTEAAAAGLATAVLVGSPGFQDNLEIPLSYTIVGMAMALIVWIALNRDLRMWHTPLIVVCTLVAIGFKEQGLVIVPLVIAAWWTRAPGASRGLAIALATIGVAYVALRLFGRTVWLPFEQDVGLGFTLLTKEAAATRFGAFPYWIYAYSGASTVANVLFTEPTNGIFSTVRAVIEGTITPSKIIRVGSSVALTGVIAWWGIRSLRSTADGQWSLQSRLVVAMVVVLLASGVLSFNYSRDRLGGMAVVFYALATFFAVRAAAVRMLTASGARFVIACVGLTLLVGAWHMRAVATLESARDRSWRNQREWLVTLPIRRVAFAHRTGYLRIMDSMVDQGTAPAVPRATRFPDWVFQVIGEP